LNLERFTSKGKGGERRGGEEKGEGRGRKGPKGRGSGGGRKSIDIAWSDF